MGNRLFLIKITSISDYANISNFIRRTNADGHIDDIRNMYIAPKTAIDTSILTLVTADFKDAEGTLQPFSFYVVGDSNSIRDFDTSISKINSFTGITVKNNKCFCYPYNYFIVSNNNGNNNIFKYEDFSTNSCLFQNILALTLGISGRLIPKNYRGVEKDIDNAIPLGKFPTCSWSGDAFTNWLTSQAVNLPTKIIGVGAEAVKNSVKNANIISGASTIAGEVASFIGDFYSASLLPNIEGGQNTADVSWSNSNINFKFIGFRAKDEYMKAIDDYFSCYGYKINELKTPNITGRTNWNYVKTIGCNIIGKENTEIPQSDINIIRKMFDNGVTLWHNPSTIYDYSQSNTIIS